MRRLEHIVRIVVIGAVPPIVGLLAGLWGTFAVLPERGVMIGSLTGLAAGLILDAVFLRRAMEQAHAASLWIWAAVYLFYSVGTFGFFMGVPVFNLLLGIPAGVLIGGRLAHAGAAPEEVRQQARQASAFTTGVLAIACIASATLALADPSTAANLEGMLGLGFEVTQLMIMALIIVGGAVLLGAQWALTGSTVRWTQSRLAGNEPRRAASR
jgi:hypothetical protein